MKRTLYSKLENILQEEPTGIEKAALPSGSCHTHMHSPCLETHNHTIHIKIKEQCHGETHRHGTLHRLFYERVPTRGRGQMGEPVRSDGDKEAWIGLSEGQFGRSRRDLFHRSSSSRN